MNLVRFDVSLHTILGPPRQVPLHAICGPTQVRFLASLAYYMEAPSDQFLRIEHGGPLRSVSSLIMEASLCPFFILYGGPQIIFCILYWGPQITFFAYYMGPLRSVSSHTISGPLSDQFHCLLYAPPPQISFFACYRGGTSDLIFFKKYTGACSDQFLRLLYGVPLRLVSLLTMWGPLRSVSVYTFWGPLSDQFFLLLDGAPSGQFLRLL